MESVERSPRRAPVRVGRVAGVQEPRACAENRRVLRALRSLEEGVGGGEVLGREGEAHEPRGRGRLVGHERERATERLACRRLIAERQLDLAELRGRRRARPGALDAPPRVRTRRLGIDREASDPGLRTGGDGDTALAAA